MPKGACLVNTARKEVIDEDDLAKILEERQDFKYITDIAPLHWLFYKKNSATAYLQHLKNGSRNRRSQYECRLSRCHTNS